MKRKFKVVVTREMEMIVELDDEHFDEEHDKQFESVFYPVEDGLQSHAEYVARGVFSGNEFIEGYGHVRVDGYVYHAAKNVNEHVSVETTYDETSVDWVEEIK